MSKVLDVSIVEDLKFQNSGFGRSLCNKDDGVKEPITIYRPTKKPLPPLVDILVCNAGQFAIGNE